jgi:phosphonopyruvate decarboxylase
MIDSTDLLIFLEKNGFSFASGVPCSYFQQMIDKLQMFDAISYIPATREDEAIGIASGIAFSGKRAFIIMQNSGYATLGDALTSLAQLYRLPMLIIISYRGLEPDRDFPEHLLMGKVTEDSLKCYRVPYWNLKSDGWQKTLEDAIAKMEEMSKPVALLVRAGVVG